jgi:hypothetical protein
MTTLGLKKINSGLYFAVAALLICLAADAGEPESS